MEKEISYANNIREGETKIYDSVGHLQKTILYSENLMDGEAKVFYPSGKVVEKYSNKDNKRNGDYLKFDTTGTIITMSNYENGFLRSEVIINRFDNSGQKNGLWREFYDNGKVQWEGKYSHGKLNGVVKKYKETGGLKEITKFEEGKLDEAAEEIIFIELKQKINTDGSLLVGGYKNGKNKEYLDYTILQMF